jgi:hypothetical protein
VQQQRIRRELSTPHACPEFGLAIDGVGSSTTWRTIGAAALVVSR